MKRIILWASALFFALTGATPSVAQQAEKLTLEDITAGKYNPSYIYGVNPLADGESYSQLSDDGSRIIRRSFKDGKELGTLFDAKTARGPVKLERIDGYVMSPDERRILLRTQTKAIYRRSYTAVYYLYDVQNRKFEALSEGGPQQMPLFSPDGNLVAFVREGNLYLVKLLFGNAESQVTKDGEFNKVINGLPDWVNEEEFSTNRSFDFSADSKMLAWVRYDESAVPVYAIQEYKGAYPTREEYDAYPGEYRYKYPVAGARNSSVSVMTFDVKDRVTRTLKLPLDSDGYVPRIHFTSDPAKLAVVTLNRRQSRMDIYMANPRSTECKLAVREDNPKYVTDQAYASLIFEGDHFGYISDRSGYKHIYWYNLAGQLDRQVTKGNYDVSAFYGYDAASGRFYYAAHKDSPLRQAVYSIDRSGRERRLTPEEGTATGIFSKGQMKYFLAVHSTASQAPVTTLRESASGRVISTLLDNKDVTDRVNALSGERSFFTFTTPEGTALNGWMVKPRDFDPAKRYPVIMYQYSGPGSQEVKDAWGMGFYPGAVLESYLTQQGFIVACVDGRGTGARGADFEKSTYLRLGQLESKDQVYAAQWLGSQAYVDKDRIGIWGWSFGGFNTLMSMSTGDGTPDHPVFRCGVAVAAPSSWKYYDTVYTERYMRTPQENPTGYADCPISRADKLYGDLLLIHGTADDNVHFRNFTEVSEAYVQAGKLFRQQVYTNRNHFIQGGQSRLHLFRTLSGFFQEKLKK